MLDLKNILTNGIVFFPNSDEKLTQIDVILDDTMYPLHTRHNGKWTAFGKPKPVVGLLKIQQAGVEIFKSDGERYKSFNSEDIIGLHVSLVSEIARNGVPYISLPTDSYRSFIELETTSGNYYFVNMSQILALKLLAVDTHYPVIDELALKAHFSAATNSGELSELVRKFDFDKLTAGTAFGVRMMRIGMNVRR